MPWASVVSDPIVPEDVLARVGDDRDGAAILFLGVVRDHADGRSVSGIRYDAYEEMAETVLAEIAGEAADRLGTDRVAVVHRTGELAIGEVSVAIAVSSPHRAESFDASRYVIEEIKKRLPVWKKEHYVDGGAEWVAGTVPPGTGPAPERASAPTIGDAPEDEANAESAGYRAAALDRRQDADRTPPDDEVNAVSAGRDAAAGANAEGGS